MAVHIQGLMGQNPKPLNNDRMVIDLLKSCKTIVLIGLPVMISLHKELDRKSVV